MNKPRENNFDLLRIISAISVISIHVSALYMNQLTVNPLSTGRILTICAYNVLSRFAVPCFVMLSGAFILANERNADYKYFYRKTFQSVGVPTLVFSIFYFLYSFGKILLKFVLLHEHSDLFSPVKNIIKGEPFYHMWYLYMMIGVYLLVPIILSLKKQIGEKYFEKFTWIFLLLSCISGWTSSHKLHWDIGNSFCFSAYLMTGYVLRKKGYSRKNSLKGYAFIFAGFAIELFMVYLRYLQALNQIPDGDLKYKLISPLCPLPVAASVCIFAGISLLTVHKDFSRLSALTFLVFLVHAGIWDAARTIIGKKLLTLDVLIAIPVSIIAVFLASCLSAFCYQTIWNRIEKKWAVSNKLCFLLHLLETMESSL